MRILLIDNYDSFTYNIYHLLYRITGQLPTLIKNDDQHWSLEQLIDFDAIVISPGPGHPAKAADMGISQQLLTQQTVVRPTLGICLGFQAMALQAASTIGLAPRPVHGEIVNVHHQAEGLFAGIPSPFAVVRYHSLAVNRLSSKLHATAYSEDGVLMGLAHRYQPWWGCQFHPESICSEYGEQLLTNFCQLARDFYQQQAALLPSQQRHCAPVIPLANAESITPTFALHCQQWPLAPGISTEQLFNQFYADSQPAIWLDSNDASSQLSQVSILADASGPYARYMLANTQQQTVTVHNATSRQILLQQSFFSWLAADLDNWQQAVRDLADLPFSVRPGWFGHLGYALAAENLATRSPNQQSTDQRIADAAMIFADRIMVIDHQQQLCYCLALAPIAQPAIAQQWLAQQHQRLTQLTAQPVSQPTNLPTGQQLTLRHSPERYLAKIRQCQAYISQGESYEICLTNQLNWQLNQPIAPITLYGALRANNPTSFSAFIHWPDWSVLSFSPERFIKIDQQRIAESRPIKGTRKRSTDRQIDQQLAHSLATDVKDKAENLMIVDLVRHDLGQVAKPDSVTVSELFVVESYATVHQLVSTVHAQLADTVSAVTAVQAAFPGGSMTGAPKKRTLEIIAQLEEGERGIYAGAIGYFAINGCADFNIVIRTLVMADQQLSLGVGGSIIALSDPTDELAETALKAQALLQPFALAFPTID